jgi:hypothetical protein
MTVLSYCEPFSRGGTSKGQIPNSRRKKTKKRGKKEIFGHLAEYANGIIWHNGIFGIF